MGSLSLKITTCIDSNNLTRTMGLVFVVGILSTYEIHSESSHWHITHAIYHVGYLGEFFRTLSAAAVMVMLVVLGLGIHCANEGVTHALAKVLRYATYFVAFVVTALTIAYYGLWVHFQVNYTNSTGYAYRHVSAWELLKTINYLTGTTAILLWIASLVIMGLAIFIFMKNSRSPLKSVSLRSIASLSGPVINFTDSRHRHFTSLPAS